MITAEEFLKENFEGGAINPSILIEFAKLHVESIRSLQIAKYYAGETGYIKKEEWDEILNNIK